MRIDASAATRVAAEITAGRARLVPQVRAAVYEVGDQVRAIVTAAAPVTASVPGYPGTIRARKRPTVDGGSVTIDTSSPFGYILEFGAGRSGPHPHFGPGYDQAPAMLESKVLAVKVI